MSYASFADYSSCTSIHTYLPKHLTDLWCSSKISLLPKHISFHVVALHSKWTAHLPHALMPLYKPTGGTKHAVFAIHGCVRCEILRLCTLPASHATMFRGSNGVLQNITQWEYNIYKLDCPGHQIYSLGTALERVYTGHQIYIRS